MIEPVDNIQIRNPAVCELVAEQQEAGVGRNASETAENLIRAGVDYLRQKRLPTPSVGSAPRRGRKGAPKSDRTTVPA